MVYPTAEEMGAAGRYRMDYAWTAFPTAPSDNGYYYVDQQDRHYGTYLFQNLVNSGSSRPPILGAYIPSYKIEHTRAGNTITVYYAATDGSAPVVGHYHEEGTAPRYTKSQRGYYLLKDGSYEEQGVYYYYFHPGFTTPSFYPPGGYLKDAGFHYLYIPSQRSGNKQKANFRRN